MPVPRRVLVLQLVEKDVEPGAPRKRGPRVAPAQGALLVEVALEHALQPPRDGGPHAWHPCVAALSCLALPQGTLLGIRNLLVERGDGTGVLVLPLRAQLVYQEPVELLRSCAGRADERAGP